MVCMSDILNDNCIKNTEIQCTDLRFDAAQTLRNFRSVFSVPCRPRPFGVL